MAFLHSVAEKLHEFCHISIPGVPYGESFYKHILLTYLTVYQLLQTQQVIQDSGSSRNARGEILLHTQHRTKNIYK